MDPDKAIQAIAAMGDDLCGWVNPVFNGDHESRYAVVLISILRAAAVSAILIV
jgi:hypothetical protein